MPLFERLNQNLTLIRPDRFGSEKELQHLVETNLTTIFNCRFIQSEFSTGPVHGGRIDSLAISEDNNPVIIEYKIVESSQLVTQSLFYLSWLNDHRGDFEVALRREFPDFAGEIDWSEIRVMCIAPEFKKYDLHAVAMMGVNIELWQYRYYDNGTLFFEEVYRRSQYASYQATIEEVDRGGLTPGKKAAITRANGVYSYEDHEKKPNKNLLPLLTNLREFLLSLDDAIEEAPKKLYVAYKLSQNFACVEVHKSKILLYLKIDPATVEPLPENCRDVTNIGHYGTGNFEVLVSNEDELEMAKGFIEMSLSNIGGN